MDTEFQGICNKTEKIGISATFDCLVALSEPEQPFVLNMQDVEWGVFERINYGRQKRTFDLTLVLKT
eukprot:CAMPEP_0116904142 /NCGR_PEP_ID=MMETSP0467-20121206/11213_1 /TAXON_ID=283647 /ORGANISM="Mesodinium pulex, Strain SPMC105" /LENGTH=66 /DNA_ID=CAMNT_0004578671 /DNA_START=1268 /DNA_END=1468 /DNA_ORIENTATION=-